MFIPNGDEDRFFFGNQHFHSNIVAKFSEFYMPELFFWKSVFRNVFNKFAIEGHRISHLGPQVAHPCIRTFIEDKLLESLP